MEVQMIDNMFTQKRNEKGQFVYTNGGGLYKRKEVNGKNIQYSRYVWEKHFGEIPKGMIIHHIDEDKMNNKIGNLAIMSYRVHNLLHSHSPWNKGITAKTNAKWAKTIKKAQVNRWKTFLPRFKKTYELRQEGKTLKEIAKIQQISTRQVCSRLKKYKSLKKQEYKERKEFKPKKL